MISSTILSLCDIVFILLLCFNTIVYNLLCIKKLYIISITVTMYPAFKDPPKEVIFVLEHNTFT